MRNIAGLPRVFQVDKEPSDGRRFALIALGAVWLMSFVYAFFAYAQDPGPDNSSIFLGWQGIAGIAAVAIFGVGVAWKKGSAVRRLSQLPMLITVVQVVAIVGLIVFAG